jgi:hypothetical protein
MAYAFVQDIAASWHEYQRFAEGAIDSAPAGLILHLAGPTDDGFRIIQIWESETACARFQTQHLASAMAALAGPGRPSPTTRHLEAGHLVLGSGGHRRCVPRRAGPGVPRGDQATRA